MADERIWLFNPETGGHFHCPADAAPAWIARGWQESEPPAEINAALAEHVPLPAPAAPEDSGDDSPPDPKAPTTRRTPRQTTSDEGVSSVG